VYQPKTGQCKNSCQDVIEHDAKPTVNVPIYLPDGPWLENIEQPEKHKRGNPP